MPIDYLRPINKEGNRTHCKPRAKFLLKRLSHKRRKFGTQRKRSRDVAVRKGRIEWGGRVVKRGTRKQQKDQSLSAGVTWSKQVGNNEVVCMCVSPREGRARGWRACRCIRAEGGGVGGTEIWCRVRIDYDRQTLLQAWGWRYLSLVRRGGQPESRFLKVIGEPDPAGKEY